MELGAVIGNFVMLAYAGAMFALLIIPISIPLIVFVWQAWDRASAVRAAVPIGAMALLVLPTLGIFAGLFAIAPSVCEEGTCTPRYDLLRLAIGAILVVSLMVYVQRRHALRSSREGRRLITTTLAAQGYYAVVANWLAYWSMQSAGAFAL